MRNLESFLTGQMLIHLPYDSSNIQAIIKDLDEQPERQEKIRRTNVVGALTKHDWVYHWGDGAEDRRP